MTHDRVGDEACGARMRRGGDKGLRRPVDGRAQKLKFSQRQSIDRRNSIAKWREAINLITQGDLKPADLPSLVDGRAPADLVILMSLAATTAAATTTTALVEVKRAYMSMRESQNVLGHALHDSVYVCVWLYA